MKKRIVTVEDLARMVAKGFEETAKADVVEVRFNRVETRLERIEKLLITEHHRRIEKLESDVTQLKELLAIK